MLPGAGGGGDITLSANPSWPLMTASWALRDGKGGGASLNTTPSAATAPQT